MLSLAVITHQCDRVAFFVKKYTDSKSKLKISQVSINTLGAWGLPTPLAVLMKDHAAINMTYCRKLRNPVRRT